MVDEVVFRARIITDQVDREVQRLKGTLGSVGDSLDTDQASQGLEDLGQNFFDAASNSERFSQQMVILQGQLGQIADQFNFVAAASLEAFKSFETAQAQVATLTDDTEGLTQAIRDQVEAQGFLVSDTEALAASYSILSAGFSDTNDVIKILGASTNAAVGGFSDLETTTRATVSILNAYKLSADDAARVTDFLVATQNEGLTTVRELGDGISSVSSIAAQLGISFEQVSAGLATITADGVNTSTAIVGYRQALLAVVDPSTDAAATAERLGVAFDAAALRSIGLEGILRQVAANSDNLTEDLSSLFGNVNAFSAANIIAADSLTVFDEKLKGVSDSSQVAADNVAIVADTTEGAIGGLLNQLNRELTEVGRGAARSLAPLLEVFANLLDAFSSLPGPAKEALGVIIGATGGLLAAGAALAGIAAILPVLSAGFAATTAAAGALLPVLLAVGAALSIPRIKQFADELEETNAEIDAFNATLNNSANAQAQLNQSIVNGLNSLAEARTKNNGLTDEEIAKARSLIRVTQLQIDKFSEQIAALEATTVAGEGQQAQINELIADRERAIAQQNRFRDGLEQLLEPLEEVADAQGKVAETAEEIAARQAEALAGFRESLQGSVQDFDTALQQQINLAKLAAITRQQTEEELQANIAAIREEALEGDIARNAAAIAEINALRATGQVSQEQGLIELSRLEAQRARLVEQSLDIQLERGRQLAEQQQQQIEDEVERQDRRLEAFDRETALLETRRSVQAEIASLEQSQLAVAIERSRITVSGLDEAIRLKERLEELDKTSLADQREIQVIQSRLAELGVSSTTEIIELERRRFEAAEQQREQERIAFELKLQSEARATEFANEQNVRAAERLVLESQLAVVKAQGNTEAEAAANRLLEAAREEVRIATEFATKSSERLANEQEKARLIFENTQAQDRFNDALELAKAEGEEINEELDKTDDELDKAKDSADRLNDSLSNVVAQIDLATASTEELRGALDQVEAATGRLNQTVAEYNNLIDQQAALSLALNGSTLAGEIGRAGGRGIGENAFVEGLNIDNLFETPEQRQRRIDQIRRAQQDFTDTEGNPTLARRESDQLQSALEDLTIAFRGLTNQATNLSGPDADLQARFIEEDFRAIEQTASQVFNRLEQLLPSGQFEDLRFGFDRDLEQITEAADRRQAAQTDRLIAALESLPQGVNINNLAVTRPEDASDAAAIAAGIAQSTALGGFGGS